MSSKRDDYELNLRATDKASAVVAKVAEAADRIDGRTVDVTVEAEDRATAEVQQLMSRIDGYTDEDQRVILTAEARNLEREVRRATLLLGRVDGEEAEAILDARNMAQAKLDGVQSALTDIDARTVDATVEADDHASGDIRRVDDRLDEYDRKTVDATLEVDQGPGFSRVSELLDEMPGNVGEAGSILSRMSTKTGAIGLATAAFSGLALKAQDVALNVDQIARFTGLSLDEASRLYAVFDDNGVEVDDLLDLLGQMSGVLADNPQLVTDMGISMDTVRQGPVATLVAVMEQFWSDGKLSDEERIAAMQLFGEEGVRQVNAVAAMIDGDLADAMENVADARIVDDDDVDKARGLRENWQELSGQLSELAQTVGPPVLDLMTRLADGATTIGQGIGLLGGVVDYFRNYDIGRLPWDQGDDDPPFWMEPENAARIREVFQATAEVADASEEAADAAADHERAVAEEVEALEDKAETLQDVVDELTGYIDAQRDAYDASIDYREASQATTTALDEYKRKISEVDEETGELVATEEERREAGEDVVAAMLDEADAAVELARANAQARGETLSHTQAVQVQNSRLAQLARYIPAELVPQFVNMLMAINDIPTEHRTEVEAAVRSGDPARIEATLNNVSRTRTAAIVADVNEQSIWSTEARLNQITAKRRSAYIAVHGPGSYDPRITQRARATGDPWTSGGDYLVGEQGPEVVRLPRGAEVVANHRLDTLDSTPESYAPTNVHVYMPAGTPAADVARAIRRQARIQGPI